MLNKIINLIKTKYEYLFPLLHFIVSFAWEGKIASHISDYDLNYMVIREGAQLSDAAEHMMVYILSRIFSILIIFLGWKLIFAVIKGRIPAKMRAIFYTIFIVGAVAGLILYPDTLGIEPDNYTNYAYAVRMMPTYWHSIYTGAMYEGALMALPHPMIFTLVQWTAFVCVVGYIYNGISALEIKGRIKWQYLSLLLFLLPESYYIAYNPYRNNIFTIMVLGYFAYLFLGRGRRAGLISIAECVIFAIVTAFIMVLRSEGIIIGAGGLIIFIINMMGAYGRVGVRKGVVADIKGTGIASGRDKDELAGGSENAVFSGIKDMSASGSEDISIVGSVDAEARGNDTTDISSKGSGKSKYNINLRLIALVITLCLAFVVFNKCQSVGSDKYYGNDYMILNTTNVLSSVLNNPNVRLDYAGADEDMAAIDAVVSVNLLREYGSLGFRSNNYAKGYIDFNQSLTSTEAAGAYMKAYYRIILHNMEDYLDVQINNFMMEIGIKPSRQLYSYSGEHTEIVPAQYYTWMVGEIDISATPYTSWWANNPIRLAAKAVVLNVITLWSDIVTGSGLNAILHALLLIIMVLVAICECAVVIKGISNKISGNKADTNNPELINVIEKSNTLSDNQVQSANQVPDKLAEINISENFKYAIVFLVILAETAAVLLFSPEARDAYLYPMLYSGYLMVMLRWILK